MLGCVSLIVSSIPGATTAAKVNALDTFDDVGPLPPQLEEVVPTAGWHILGNGLPLLVVHKAKRVSLEESLWSTGDWPWMALFVRIEKATRPPTKGDIWTQLYSIKTEEFDASDKELETLNPSLLGAHDYAVLLHVEELRRLALVLELWRLALVSELWRRSPWQPRAQLL